MVSLLLLLRMAVQPHLLACLGAKLGHQGKRVVSSLALARLDTPRSESDTRLGDEQQQSVHDHAVVAGATTFRPPDLRDYVLTSVFVKARLGAMDFR
jgi:hypothetical protein